MAYSKSPSFRAQPSQMEVVRFRRFTKPILLLILLIALVLYFIKTQKRAEDLDYAKVDKKTLDFLLSGGDPTISQRDPRIVNYIKRNLLVPPSEKPYKLTGALADPSVGQGYYVRKLFKNMTGGFFVEAGGYDGETFSNTLYMERFMGWRGLLVEGNPTLFQGIVSRNRKAWLSNCCLSTKPYPHKVNFTWVDGVKTLGGILEDNELNSDGRKKVQLVQCLPLLSLLEALDVTVVDYFSLDVEGSEMGVLESIPFDKIIFKVMSIEYNHLAGVDMRGYGGVIERSFGAQTILEYLVPKGYHLVGISPSNVSIHHDVVFAHKSYFSQEILDMHLSERSAHG